MSTARMHADEVPTDAALVRRLVAAQFPRWAELPIEPVESAGTDNALYRLGEKMVVRLPRIHWAADPIATEQTWLPRLTTLLPLAVPTVLAQGTPGEGYPWRWSIYRWLAGDVATTAVIGDPVQMARDLAAFIGALRQVDPTGAPLASRGQPLALRDADVRQSLDQLHNTVNALAAAAWEAALRAHRWEGPPTWVHGDLLPTNLLVQEGRLTAVIDWGNMGVGDPACDVMVAWSVLRADTRAIFRDLLAVDEAMWARGRGWALCFGLVALPYYQTSNPVLAAIARDTIAEVIADYLCET